MNRQIWNHFDLDRQPFSRLWWIGLPLLGLLLMGLLEYVETDILTPAIQLDQLYTFKVGGYAHLLLVASTILYVWHLCSNSDMAGKWASWFAMFGTLGLVLTLAARWIETYYLQRPGHVPLSGTYEMMALFSVLTIIIYLAMEQVYRTRSAGAFVMVIVLGSVLFQIWLVESGQAVIGNRIPMLKSYWKYAHVLGNFIGYGAFAIAGAMGAGYLFKSHAERNRSGGFAMASLPDLQRIDRSMHQAILLGFPLFTLATVLGSLWAREAWGRYWAWDPKETWALIVWATYASYFYFRLIKRWSSWHMACWAVAGFGMTVFYCFGVKALWPGLHG